MSEKRESFHRVRHTELFDILSVLQHFCVLVLLYLCPVQHAHPWGWGKQRYQSGSADVSKEGQGERDVSCAVSEEVQNSSK